MSDRRVHSDALIVTEDLTNKVVAWAIEIASYAAQLPSKQARDDYLRERRRELMTGAQAEDATPRDTRDCGRCLRRRGAPNYGPSCTAGARIAVGI